jgi:hypothetical protein
VSHLDGFGRSVYRTSSYSNTDNCVEVLLEPEDGLVRVRDTKDRSRPPVAFPAPHWRMFVTSLQAGEFDRK